MSKTENVELTVLCLIEDGDKILLQNRVGVFLSVCLYLKYTDTGLSLLLRKSVKYPILRDEIRIAHFLHCSNDFRNSSAVSLICNKCEVTRGHTR